MRGTSSRALSLLLSLGLFWAGVGAVPLFAGEPLDTEKISKQVGPAVVLLVAESDTGKALGTGFFVSEDGLIVTNYHVIDGADRIMARNSQGGYFPITRVLARDKVRDLAVLKIEGKNLPYLQLAAEDSIPQGARVAVFGNPIGLQASISDGIVSASRFDGERKILQITAPISHGSSGSPVVDAGGNVVGVATFMLTSGEALNFAVCASHVRELMGRAQSAAKDAVVKGDTPDGLYAPDPTVLGSAADDRAAMKDPLYARMRELEKSPERSIMMAAAKELSEKYPKSALAARRLADAYDYAKFHDEAVAACKHALDLDPKSVRGWNNLAIATRNAGQRELALEYFKKATKLGPMDAKAWLDYAWNLPTDKPYASTRLETLRHAEAALDEGTLDDESGAYDLRADMGRLYIRLGRYQDAYRNASLAANLHPDSAIAQFALAESALELKKYFEVKPALDKAAKLYQRRPIGIYTILARSQIEQGQWDEGVHTLEKALEIEGNNQTVLYWLSVTYVRKPKVDREDIYKAGQCLDKLKAGDPKYGQKVEDEVRNIIARRSGNGNRNSPSPSNSPPPQYASPSQSQTPSPQQPVSQPGSGLRGGASILTR